jgi:hypothetical protein
MAPQQPHGPGSSIGAARVEDNVVSYRARHGLHPGQVHEPGPPGALPFSQRGQPSAAPQRSESGQAEAGLQPVQVDGSKTPNALEWAALAPLVEKALKRANESRDWYKKKASSVKRLSSGIRYGAIVLGLFGGLCQLLPKSVFGEFFSSLFGAPENVSALVFFLFAGVLLLIDQVFAYSSSYMRFRKIDLRLGKLIRMFEFEVDCERIGCGAKPLSAERADSFLARLKAFRTLVEDITIEDTETWIVEFKTGLGQIDQFARGGGQSRAGQKPA